MVYLYSMENCPKCEALKSKLNKEGIKFEERSSDRIKKPEDAIDQEALVEASINNMEMPVIVYSK